MKRQFVTYLPVFFLYEFDFVRKAKTKIKVLIDGKNLRLDPFPFPMPLNMQWRYYTRYSPDCQIFEFLNTQIYNVKEVELNDELIHVDGDVEYHFETKDSEVALSWISLLNVNHQLRVEFDPAVTLHTHKGVFHILPEAQMGRIDGSYEVIEAADKVSIKFIPDKGWKSVPNSTITKMLLSDKSVFCNWSKKYIYEQVINKKDWSTECKWTNGNV